jgi:hypothetical protein
VDDAVAAAGRIDGAWRGVVELERLAGQHHPLAERAQLAVGRGQELGAAKFVIAAVAALLPPAAPQLILTAVMLAA